MKEFWDERYKNDQYVYGVEPNHFFKQQIDKLPVGKILMPAEGEGRNAVYAAKLGWECTAFDISVEGKNKALQLAELNNVQLNYQVGNLETLSFEKEQFDAIALIYAHFPADIKIQYHLMFDSYLKKGGIIIFEAFSKKHIEFNSKNEKVGGPKDVNMLFSIEEICADFCNYDVLEMIETEIELNEGVFHNGQGAVIRFVGRKK